MKVKKFKIVGKGGGGRRVNSRDVVFSNKHFPFTVPLTTIGCIPSTESSNIPDCFMLEKLEFSYSTNEATRFNNRVNSYTVCKEIS